MATSSQSQVGQSRVARKILLLALGIALFIAAYTAAWFYAADRLRGTVLTAIAPRAAKSISGECGDIAFRGYPFRIGLFCSKIDMVDRKSGVSASFGALRSAAQVYAPSHIVWELDSPAEIRDPRGLAVSAAWEDLRSSLVTRLAGIDRTSLVVKAMKAKAVSAATGQTIDFNAAMMQMHLRRNGADLDGAITVTDGAIAAAGWPQLLPRFSAIADVTLAGKAGLIDGTDAAGLAGAGGELRRLAADIGDGRIARLSGPFSFDAEGLLSGRFKLEIEKLGAWNDSARQALPQARSSIDTAVKFLRMMAGGGDSASVDLVVQRGRVTIGGFIPLGEIPPI